MFWLGNFVFTTPPHTSVFRFDLSAPPQATKHIWLDTHQGIIVTRSDVPTHLPKPKSCYRISILYITARQCNQQWTIFKALQRDMCVKQYWNKNTAAQNMCQILILYDMSTLRAITLVRTAVIKQKQQRFTPEGRWKSRAEMWRYRKRGDSNTRELDALSNVVIIVIKVGTNRCGSVTSAPPPLSHRVACLLSICHMFGLSYCRWHLISAQNDNCYNVITFI